MSGDRTGSGSGPRVGLFEFLRDVLTAALDKGQFPSALTAIILLAVIWNRQIAKLRARELIMAAENEVGRK